jgi:hypothetical protein
LFLVFMALVAWTPEASAYDLYSGSDNNTDTGNCANCHGTFNSGTYTSLKDGSTWGQNLMTGHDDLVMGISECAVCHGGGKKAGNTFLHTSNGGTGFDPISCVGCHGRDADHRRE